MSTTVPEPVPVVPAKPSFRPLRIWPALILLGILGICKGAGYFAPEMTRALVMLSVFGPMICGVVVLGWWIIASRATARERVLGPLAVLLVATAAYFLADQSLRGMAFGFFVVPIGIAAFTVALVCVGRFRPSIRLTGAIFGALIGFCGWDLARNDGIWGDFKTSLHLRWTPTAEDRFLATLNQDRTAAHSSAAQSVSRESLAEPAWPGFRGPNRDSLVPGVVLDTDWGAHPPKELWRRKVGPAWSSFAVAGHLLFTQEQRGESEVVACYDADTGAERWTHESPARFWETVSGAGPRATPTLSGGRLFTVGSTGLVHCLDPLDGSVVWERDLAKDAARKPPTWGFSSSPLVVGEIVVVYAGGPNEKGVFGYDRKTGKPQWSVPAGDHSYSSPQLASLLGQNYVLMLTNTGLGAIDPVAGKNVWTYDWKFEGYRAIQPLVVENCSVLLGTGMGTGTRRVDLGTADGPKPASPQITDRWTSLELKPDFNDYVAHKGFLYGFDHNIFACVDLKTGKRTWKKGRYGNGQVLLLPDADQLLVLSETGEVVIVRTDPADLVELARTKALSDKTWNHPVLVGKRLYVRNGEEAVCLELPTVERKKAVATAGSQGTLNAGRSP